MFKRAVVVETPKMTTAYGSAREYVVPVYETAKESGSHALQAALAAMVPVVAAAAPAVAAAKSKGADLLSSDTAHEAKERAAMMLAAAKGDVVVKQRRRWPLVIAFFALGSALGAAVMAWLRGMSEAQPAYTESGHAGANVDLSHPLTESNPQPVTVLPDVTEDDETLGDYSDPKATF